MIDFINTWAPKTEIPITTIVAWIGISLSKYYHWQKRYGKVNEHNAKVPRDHWLEQWEKDAIVGYYKEHPHDGYRRQAFMMLDDDVVAASPSTVYRVLKEAQLLMPYTSAPSKKGTGFVQPTKAHEHWHVDIAHVNIRGTFCFLCMVLDGYSRAIIHWEIRTEMKSEDIQLIIQRGLERYPGENPCIISDNGPQFIAKDFKEYVRMAGLTHVRTSPYYPQSNGKLERVNRTVKHEGLKSSPDSLEELNRIIRKYIDYYNNKRLNSAIEYIAPYDKLAGRETEIFLIRDQRLAAAREKRRLNRQAERTKNTMEPVASNEGLSIVCTMQDEESAGSCLTQSRAP